MFVKIYFAFRFCLIGTKILNTLVLNWVLIGQSFYYIYHCEMSYFITILIFFRICLS